MFEIARVFSKDSDGLLYKTKRIGGLWYGAAMPEQWGEKTRNADFYDIKADVENLLKTKQLSLSKPNIPPCIQDAPPILFQTAKSSALSANCIRNGCKNTTCRKHRWYLKSIWPPCWNAKKMRYQAVSKFQPVRRDLAFVMPETMTHDDLLAALKGAANKLVQEISVFDVYRGTGLPEGMKSMAVKVILQDMENTLTDETVEPVIGKLIDAATAAGAQLRS